MTSETLDFIVDLNVERSSNCSAKLSADGRSGRGHVVNVSSIGGIIARPIWRLRGHQGVHHAFDANLAASSMTSGRFHQVEMARWRTPV